MPSSYRASGDVFGITQLGLQNHIDPGQLMVLDGERFPMIDGVRVLRGHHKVRSKAEDNLAAFAPAHHVIFLNRLPGGGTYSYGADDSRNNRSSALHVGTAQLAPYGGTEAEWQEVLAKVKDKFSRFNVTVTDQRPAAGDYIDAVVTGSQAYAIGLADNFTGYAPYINCELIPNAVVFVFAGSISSTESIAATAAQEIGHAVGMDHQLNCRDPMSYLHNDANGWCGPKQFQDSDDPCGESPIYPRSCPCGKPSQNSYRRLLEVFGPGPGPELPLPPTPDPEDKPPVIILKTRDEISMPANSTIEVSAEVTDDKGLKSVKLIWDYTGLGRQGLECVSGASHPEAGWSCSKKGNVYTWKLDVGTGVRTYRVRAVDTANQEVTSASQTIHLGGIHCAEPAVASVSPGPAETLKRGLPYSFAVRVYSRGEEIRSVRMIWEGGPNGRIAYPMARQTADESLWELSTQIEKGAPLGDRAISFEVVNVSGTTVRTLPSARRVVKK